MPEGEFKRIVESRFGTQCCPRCGTSVYLEQEQCPRCQFDLTSWRWNWFMGMIKAFTAEDIKAGKLASGGGQGTATRSELGRIISGWPKSDELV